MLELPAKNIDGVTEVEVPERDSDEDLPVTVALKPSVVAHLKQVAEREGMDYHALLQTWIVARLEQEPWTLESPQADTPPHHQHPEPDTTHHAPRNP